MGDQINSQKEITLTEKQIDEMINRAVQRGMDAHPCKLNQQTLDVVQAFGESINPETVHVVCRIFRMWESASFAIGSTIMKAIIIGGGGLLLWLFFKKQLSVE